jgi:hypothetical protein
LEFSAWALAGCLNPEDDYSHPVASSALATLFWGVDGLPGDDEDDPLPYEEPEDEDDDSMVPPENMMGYQLVPTTSGSGGADATAGDVTPLSDGEGGGYGIDSNIYFSTVPEGPEVTGYDFLVEDNTYTSLTIPATPAGQAFDIQIDGHTVPLASGETLDFTQYVPGGTERFTLLGLDATQYDETNPFVHGLQFADEAATLTMLDPVPEPSTLLLAIVAVTAATLGRPRRGRK